MAFTYFFRDLQTLEMVRDHAIPSLRTRRYIRIWDAGCAHGPEPYSIAIILRENMGQMIFRNVQIHATDIDGSNLFGNIIREGVYPKEQVQRVPASIFQRYFLPHGDKGEVRISDEIRRSITYQQHDLLSCQPLRADYSLIVCKNVLLHFSEAERIRVLRMFHTTLEDGGYLVTEQTQKMPASVAHLFTPVVSNAQLFRKC